MKVLKFIHTSDLHLDSALSSISSMSKARQRRGELTDTFYRIAQFAVSNQIDGIIVAGDMFDIANASFAVKKQVADIIANAKEVVFYLLSGNHDRKAFDDDFVAMLPQNAILLKNGVQYRHDNVTITAVDGQKADENSLPQLPVETFNVVVAHGQIVSGNGEGINPKKFASKNVDYFALGHIHSFSHGNIDRRGKWVYSGCPEGHGFDECGEKGFVIFDTVGNVQFVPYCKRRCHEIEVDVTGLGSYVSQLEKIKKQIEGLSADDVYKIVLCGEVEPDVRIDTFALTNRLDHLFFVKVVDKTITKFDWQKYSAEKSLKGEFFRVVNSLDVSDEDKQYILKCGFAAMDGVEVDNDKN